MRWFRGTTTIKPAYQFTYDGMGRLAEAAYTQNTYLMNRRPKYTETYSYDAMGNVTALTRQGWLYGSTWGLIDDLVMTYDGNRLVKCDDAVSAQPTNNGAHHFTDLADEDEEYEYDGNGNMTKDLNREITSIEYNSLNLPRQITFSDATKMKLTYDAAGNKLRAEYWTIPTFNPGGPIGPVGIGGGDEPQGGGIVGPILPPINQNDPQVVTDYCGNLIYRNDTLSMLFTEEGYVTFDERGEPLYHYYLRDHLGSVRVVLDGDGTVEQVNDYYPSGTLMYTSTNGTVQPYKFGQKELERTLPLDEYDFGARWMDPTVGARFTTMDPLCEKYYSISPYAYCHGDPLNFIDPDGRDLILHGDSTNISNSLEQIQNGAGEGISIYYSDADSNLKYQISDGYDTSLLSEQAKLLIKIIDNHNIIVNINAISRNELGDGRWFVAGGFLGNEVMDNGTIIANQVINPRQLAIMDEAGSPGQNIFHEISESYNGAELRLQGVDSSNLYNAAHKTAMPQTELKGGFFNFTGNYSDTFIPISNSYKYFVQTQRGIKVLYNIDLLIKKY
jgi:RHS repeat-associated protein